jgi:nitrite reductase (NADH) small subunit
MTARTTRHPLGRADQIPRGEGRTFVVAGRRVAVFRARDGRVYATQADCPHRGGPLADGLVGAGTLICPLHERRFDLATGSELGGGDCRLQVFPVTVGPDGALAIEVAGAIDSGTAAGG